MRKKENNNKCLSGINNDDDGELVENKCWFLVEENSKKIQFVYKCIFFCEWGGTLSSAFSQLIHR